MLSRANKTLRIVVVKVVWLQEFNFSPVGGEWRTLLLDFDTGIIAHQSTSLRRPWRWSSSTYGSPRRGLQTRCIRPSAIS